jgi:hypothetical protein
MGTRNDGFVNAAGALVYTQRISQDVDLVSLRINYKFGAVPMMGMGMGMMGMGK